MRVLRRISGFVLGAVGAFAVLFAFGWLPGKDRGVLVLERFVTSCSPGQVSEGILPNVAWLDFVPDPTTPGGHLHWDDKAQVFVRSGADRCTVEAIHNPLTVAQESLVQEGFVALGKSALPGSVYEELSEATNADIFHVFKSAPTAPGAALLLVRWGHERPPNDPLVLTYTYPKLGDDDA